jgi:c-di-GMP-binding flagellar brake protein YcgR
LEKRSISFSYVNISELDRDFISQICIKKQLEQQRNRIR